MAETEKAWETYSTEVRLKMIGEHLSVDDNYAGTIMAAMCLILFLESTTQIFINEIFKIFAK